MRYLSFPTTNPPGAGGPSSPGEFPQQKGMCSRGDLWTHPGFAERAGRSAVQDPGPKAPGAADSLEQLAGHGARVPSLCVHPSTRHHDPLRALGLTFPGSAERFSGREGGREGSGSRGVEGGPVLSGGVAVGRSGSPPSPAAAALCNSEQGLPLWASVSPSRRADLLLQHHHTGRTNSTLGRHCAELSGKTPRAEVLSSGACSPELGEEHPRRG